ncbi:MAG: FG-GAP repeat domain-containing protein, partial [Candidatus Binatia bacterium]
GMAGGPVENVKRVRFRATGYQPPGSPRYCVAELHVYGDTPVPPSSTPTEVNLGELYSAQRASGFLADFQRPEAANDENPNTAWYHSAHSGAYYEFAFPVDVTATRLELAPAFSQPGGGAQAGHISCRGQIQLFDANDAVLFDTGDVGIDTGTPSGRSFPFPNVAGVRRARLTQTQACRLHQINLASPMGFDAVRLIGPPPVPFPRFQMFERWRALGGILSTPLVANLSDDNGDGEIDRLDVPDIVAILRGASAAQNGFITAVRGDSGEELFTAGAPSLVSAFSEPAIGDIDDDGLPEIVAVHSDGNHLIAFENDGTQKWVSDALAQSRFVIGSTTVVTGAVSIANLDGAGRPEIIVGAAVYDADGHVLG